MRRMKIGPASWTLDKNGEMIYNDIVKNESCLEIIIVLPISGKSSVVVDVLSQEFQSRVIDHDKAKEEIPEFNWRFKLRRNGGRVYKVE